MFLKKRKNQTLFFESLFSLIKKIKIKKEAINPLLSSQFHQQNTLHYKYLA